MLSLAMNIWKPSVILFANLPCKPVVGVGVSGIAFLISPSGEFSYESDL
jgi:hypothetical protein